MLVFKIAPNIGHYSVKDFLCPAAVKTLPVIMTNDFNFVDISFFLLVIFDRLKHLILRILQAATSTLK